MQTCSAYERGARKPCGVIPEALLAEQWFKAVRPEARRTEACEVNDSRRAGLATRAAWFLDSVSCHPGAAIEDRVGSGRKGRKASFAELRREFGRTRTFVPLGRRARAGGRQ